MKYLLIAFIAICAIVFIGFFIQYIKSMVIEFKIWQEKRKANREDLWMY